MLKKIEIENFQNHKKTILNLSPHVNIISGPSDNGKSAIFRASNLVINNRPQGYSYKPWDSKKKDITISKLIFDDGEVIRKKSNTINEYILKTDKEEIFTALGSNVPEEISSFINFSDYNFQQQHDKYFFIQDTPAERAKKINDICGLSIIDEVTTKSKSIVKEAKAEVEKPEKDIKELKEKISSLNYIKEAETLISNIDELGNKKQNSENKIKSLKYFLEEINVVDVKIKDREEFLKSKIKLNFLKSLVEKYNQISIKYQSLKYFLEEINSVDTTLQKTNKFLNIKLKYFEIKELISKYNLLKEKNDELSSWLKEENEVNLSLIDLNLWLKVKDSYFEIKSFIDQVDEIEKIFFQCKKYLEDIESVDNQIKNSNLKIEKFNIKKKEFMDSFEFCPFCKRGM